MFDLIPFNKGNNDVFSIFEDMEKNFFRNFGEHFPCFKTDIIDKGDKFVLEADMPGFSKEDININIENNMLTITAKHNVENEDNTENYIRRERRYGSYTRSFDVSNIKAE